MHDPDHRNATSNDQTIGGITIPTTTGAPTPAVARQIAAAAYVYGYPLVIMDVTKDQLTATPAPIVTTGILAAPINQFVKSNILPTASATGATRPNVDTLYSIAWLNLTKEPMVLSVPASNGRYYLMELLDAWMNVFASPGVRTLGNRSGNFAIVGPKWNGTLPAGMTKIQSPTETVWIAGRTQQNGPADLPAAIAFDSQYKLTPLSAWGTNYTPPTNVSVNHNVNTKMTPVDQVANMNPATFYNRMAMLMVANPPSAADTPVLDQIARIGIIPGVPFNWTGLNATIQNAITQGAKDGLAQVNASGLNYPGSVNINGWTLNYNFGNYGTNYTLRAGVAQSYIGINIPQDAMYPVSLVDATGAPYSGAYDYIIHFPANKTPPVNAFWSLTMYNERNFLVANPINRYAISPHLGPLKYSANGSLDIYIQNTTPGLDRESNWLPAPSNGFIISLRLYWPQEAALNGSWVPPAVQRVGPAATTANTTASAPTRL